ncbi:MAG: LysM peptidoglycan-binding domain-containing protein [Chloroflexi bacterium]|nr:LysM peptidoglycan-binding domain-containing protein [Chloroflexota bacterium]
MPLPPSQATVQPTESLNADNLFAQIDDPWTLEDWPTVISILEQLLILDPTFPEVNEKLYAAYVNYGHQLSGNGNKSGAQSAFENALAIQPDGGEAQLGLNALLEVTSTPTVTTYIVVGGDTLFSISQRFGTTVDALRAANGLVGNAISPGQTLIIPHS